MDRHAVVGYLGLWSCSVVWCGAYNGPSRPVHLLLQQPWDARDGQGAQFNNQPGAVPRVKSRVVNVQCHCPVLGSAWRQDFVLVGGHIRWKHRERQGRSSGSTPSRDFPDQARVSPESSVCRQHWTGYSVPAAQGP